MLIEVTHVPGISLTVASPEAARVTAFYGTPENEREAFPSQWFSLLASLSRVTCLSPADDPDEAKCVIGDAVFHLMYQAFLREHTAVKKGPMKCINAPEWCVRGPDRKPEEIIVAREGIRTGITRLSEGFCKFIRTPNLKARETLYMATIDPACAALMYDRRSPGADLRAMADLYRLSLRQCFEAHCLKSRIELIENQHKKFSK